MLFLFRMRGRAGNWITIIIIPFSLFHRERGKKKQSKEKIKTLLQDYLLIRLLCH